MIKRLVSLDSLMPPIAAASETEIALSPEVSGDNE